MKRILLSFVAIATIALTSFGQAPEGFKYQAVVRDAGNTILNNQAVGMQIEILQGGIGGTVVYTETFAPTTNTYGLVNLEIGVLRSTVTSGRGGRISAMVSRATPVRATTSMFALFGLFNYLSIYLS
jgi:hypothetical protein